MDNPKAFPSGTQQDGYNTGATAAHEGMTLRDYFAAKALQGFMAGPSMEVLEEAAATSGLDQQTFIVRTAYQMADAMLAERESSSHRQKNA